MANLGAQAGSGLDASDITTGTLGNTVQDNITRLGTVTTGTMKNTIHSDSTFPTGHVIQTVFKQSGEQGSTTSTSWDNRVTGMDTTITPRFASSSILITASFGHYSSGDYSIYDIYKNASDVTETYNLSGKSFGIAQASGQSKWMHTTATYEDPLAENSITQKTYSLSFKCHSSGTTYLGWGSSSIIVLTLQEIAG